MAETSVKLGTFRPKIVAETDIGRNVPLPLKCGGCYTYRSGFSLKIAICSSVNRPVLKRACSSEKINSHRFMDRALNIVDRMGGTRGLFKCATVVRGCAARAVHVRHPFAVNAHMRRVRRRLEKLRHLASVRLTCMLSFTFSLALSGFSSHVLSQVDISSLLSLVSSLSR